MNGKYAVVVIAAVVIAAATVSAAVLPTAPAPRANPVTPGAWVALETTALDFPEGAYIEQAAVVVIKTQEEYAAFQRAVSTAGDGAPNFPLLDFTSNFLVVASYGFKDLGHDISVAGAKANNEQVVVTVDQQVDNPMHCRVTHNIEFVGAMALVVKPAVADFSQTVVGVNTQMSEMPYDPWYNCACPEM